MKLAVCSNKPHPAAVKVIAQLFDGEFDMVVGQSEAIRRNRHLMVRLWLRRNLV